MKILTLLGLFVCVSFIISPFIVLGEPNGPPNGPPNGLNVNVVNQPVVDAMQSGDWSVTVNNDESDPIVIQDAGPAGRFQDEILMTIAVGTVGNSEPVFDIPEGMTGIVKFVSGRTFTDVDSWVSCTVVQMINGTPLGAQGEHHTITSKRFRQPRFQNQDGDYSHEFSQAMEFYVPGGRQAGFTCIMIPAPTRSNGAIVSLNMSGVLVGSNGQ